MDEYKRRKVEPAMPPNPAPHIIGRLIEIGLTEAAGMGAVPVSWGEIDAWCRRTCIRLAPWEARLIRRLSTEYLAEGRRAESETCPPPWHSGPTQREIETEQSRLMAVLG